MLDWFTTIPGILILCGVLLLIIAIILFILGAKKSKKDNVSNANIGVNNASSNNSVSDLNTVNASSNVGVVSAEPTINPTEGSSVTVSPVMEDTNTVVTNDTPAFEMPKIDTTPVEEVKAEDVSVPVVDNNQVETTTNPVYGGVTPDYNFTETEKPVTIYGGNDPLEATQTLPKMEEHHLPYGGVNPEDKIGNINPINNVPTPVVENISEMPTVNEVKPVDEVSSTEQENVPVIPVVNIPSMEEESVNTASTASVEVNNTSTQDSVPTVEEL